MTEYLITVSGSRDILLRATRIVTTDDPDAARQAAIRLLDRYRSMYLGGDRWDTWTVAVRGTGAFTAPVVAQGFAGRD